MPPRKIRHILTGGQSFFPFASASIAKAAIQTKWKLSRLNFVHRMHPASTPFRKSVPEESGTPPRHETSKSYIDHATGNSSNSSVLAPKLNAGEPASTANSGTIHSGLSPGRYSRIVFQPKNIAPAQQSTSSR